MSDLTMDDLLQELVSKIGMSKDETSAARVILIAAWHLATERAAVEAHSILQDEKLKTVLDMPRLLRALPCPLQKSSAEQEVRECSVCGCLPSTHPVPAKGKFTGCKIWRCTGSSN